METELTRASLLSRVRNTQDHDAWREFEGTYRELVLRYCRSRGLQVTDAEDVLQAVLIKMVGALPGFAYDPARGRFRDFLYRAVKWAVSDRCARLNRAPRTVDTEVLNGDPPAGGADEPDDAWDREWTDHHYRLGMTSLRRTFEPRSIEVFERLLAGESVEAVASVFGSTPAAIHKIKQRARDRLKELIEEQIREEDRL